MLTNKKTDLKTIVRNGKWLETVLADDVKDWQYRQSFDEAYDILGVFRRNVGENALQLDSFNSNYTLRILEQIAGHGLESEYTGYASKPKTHHMTVFKDDGLSHLRTFDTNRFLDCEDTLRLYDLFREYFFLAAAYGTLPFSKVEARFNFLPSSLQDKHSSKFSEYRDLNLKFYAESGVSYEVTDDDLLDLEIGPVDIFEDIWQVLGHFFYLKNSSKLWLKQSVETGVPLKYGFASLDSRLMIIGFYNDIQQGVSYFDNEGFQALNEFRRHKYYDDLSPLFSNIFIDFLLAGGLDYCGFCGYCGNFWVAERKGRKKFCSDICRTNNQRPK